MAKYSNVVEYNVVTDVDTSGIVKLQNELTKLKQSLKFDKNSFSQLGFDDAKIDKSIRKVNQLQTAITAAFNPKIGTIDLSKLNASLQREHTSLQMIVKDWEQMGTRGTMAISNLSNALLSMNKGAMNVNTTLSKVANTFSNTVRWGITASIFQEMMSSVQGAVSYMKDLDESLTNIQMVTNSSKEDMRELAQYANQAAQALGSTTTDYTNAVKVFVQEGFSERESKQYANLSTKLANVSEQSTDVTSDQITAYRNAFQLDYQQTVEAMDKVANVANNTASNVNELMTASQRAASVAQAVGSSQDSFLAAIATIESVTRQSAEEIGNGLKTIYQRFADIKVSGKTDDGVDYGQYAKALQQVGVDVLDVSGQFKGMDQILAELQEVWSGLDDTMKIAVGEKVAGKFQYNRFAALMNNPEYYQKAFAATQNAGGMMDQMNEYYMEGIEGRLNTLQAAGEQVMSTLFDQDTVEPIIEDVTKLVNGLNDMVDAAGGLTGVVQVLGAVMLRTFSTQIAGTVSNIATAISTVAANSRNANQLQTTAQLVGLSNYTQSQGAGSVTGKLVAGVADNYSSLSDKTQEKIRDLSQQIVELEEQKTNVLKEQQGFFDEINSRATEEKVIIEEQLQALGQQIKILREKEKAGNITAQEQDELVLLREQAKELGTVRKIYNDIAKACAGYTKELANGAPITQEMVAQVEKWKQETSNLGINISELTRLMEELGIAEGNLKIGESMVDDIIQMSNFEASVNNVIKTLSGITSIAFGMSMLGDMFRVLTDESATLEEKLDAVVMNGLMGLTMLLPGLATIATQMKALTVEYLVQTGAITANSTAEEVNNAIKAQGVGLTIKAIALKVADIAKTVASTVATTAYNIVAAIRNVLDGNWVAIAAAAVIAAGALAIGVAAIASAWINANGEVARANQEFEKQNEILTETKRNYQDVAENFESLNNSLDKIKDMRSSLDDMKEGTDEWKEAVRKLNMEILTLIQTYPEIAKYVNNENGILSLDESGMDSFYNEQIEKANHLNDINNIQQINTLNAKNNQLIAAYASQHGVSSESLRNAINNNKTELDGREDLTKSFAELVATIQSNNTAIETLNGTVGTLNNNYTNYAGNAKIDDIAAMERAQQRWGAEMFDEYGNSLGYKTDLSARAGDAELLKAISEAIGQDVVSGKDTSIFDDTLKVITKDGEEIEHSTQIWLQILANSEEATKAADELFETNKTIYENLGAKWNEETRSFEGDIGEDNKAALDAFQNNESFKNAVKEYADAYGITIDTVEQFSEAIKAGIINVDGLSESLSKLNVNVDLTHNINGNEFTNRIDISSNKDNLKKILDDAEMSEGAFDRMARDSYEDSSGYYQQEKERLQELIEAKKEDSIITDDERKEIAELNSEIEGLNESSRDTTAMIINMSDGVVDLRKKIEDISEILSNEALEGSVEWYEALTDLDEGLSQVLNIDAGTLSDAFLESGDALAYAQRMAEGDMSAIDDLRKAASQDIIQNLNIQVTGEESVDELRAGLMAELNQLQMDIDAGAITVTTDLDTNPFIQKLNEMLAASQISEEQATQILSSIGMEANIKHAKGKGTVQAIEYRPTFSGQAIDVELPGGGKISLPGVKMSPVMTPVDVETDIPYLEGTHYTGSGVQTAGVAASNPSYSGGYNGNSAPKGGGKSSSPKSNTPKNTKPKDKDKTEWDYLTDITNDLDRAAAVMEKLSKLEDRLYGSSRVSQIKKLQKEYKNYIGLLEQEVKLAKDHAQLLRTNAYDENGNLTINGYAYRAGFNQVNFDAQGNLENGKAIEARLVNRVNAAINDYNAHRNADDASYYEERVSLAQKDHEGFLKALSEYESTLGKIEDGQSQIQDYKEKIQDATDEIVDAIQDGIEDVLEAIDNQRDFNKMYRDWMQGGSGYSHLGNQHRYYTEGLEGLLSPGQNGVSIFDMQLQSLQDRIEDFKGVFDGDSQDADDEKLSEQAAFENLQEATKNIMGSLEKAVDYYDSLLETVQDASDKMDELIDDRLDEFNNLEDYLDTRLDQLKLLFGDKSYEQQAQLYNEKIAVNMEKIVSINTAIEAKQATVKALEGLEESGKELSTEERKELKDARNKVTSLQKEQLDTESQLLQDIVNRLGNQVNAELDTAINNLFGGEDIDWLTQQWELSTRFSEQYLDDYNRAFELQKLQVKYQELLNDTQATSAMAQQRISAQMMQQLKYLREKNHLSEYDVEYAEKKLEILQRELALEDARNNKSQMRLQRNAAGNYDFVYAADEDAINDAKMALLNAQQEAYNLSKRIYKEIYDGALKLSQELKQMVFDVATDASLTTEQQAERIKWIMENTGEYLGNASVELGEISVNLYNDIADAEQLIAEENLGNLADTFEIMRAQSKATQESVGQDLSNSRDNAIDAASDTFESIQGLFNTTQESIDENFNDIEGNLNTMLGRSFTNADETIKKIAQGSSERSKDIIEVIGNIDKNFELSVGNMLTNTESIDETFKGAFDNIAGDKEDSYLNQYKNKTTEVLKQAGDEYNTFTEQSINYATEQLELLRQATQDWNSDLDMLKQMIKDNADEIKGWKTEIDFAMTASKDFITESGNLQIAFGKIGTMATIAGDMLDSFGEAAYDAGSAVDTMSNDIEDAYYAIKDAAEAAAQAYDDMAWSASNAAREADSARIAAENAQAALNAAGVVNNLAAGARNIINNAFNSFKNTVFRKSWGGGSYNRFGSSGGGKFATGGYTGTWTDQGIDDKSGKWAILHQKELVLNADDTKNMLSAVEVVRDIMSNINSLPSLGKITTQNNLTDTIEQRVEINATFPGVTEAIQIKQALEQIADNAYQVANKYKY